MPPEAGMHDLIVHIILPWLDAVATARVGMASTELRALCTSDAVWEPLTRRDFQWSWDWPVPPAGPFYKTYQYLQRNSQPQRVRCTIS